MMPPAGSTQMEKENVGITNLIKVELRKGTPRQHFDLYVFVVRNHVKGEKNEVIPRDHCCRLGLDWA